MADKWPAAMLFSTAAAYLDCSVRQVERLVKDGKLGAIQYNTERGDRRLLREEIDNYLAGLRDQKVA